MPPGDVGAIDTLRKEEGEEKGPLFRGAEGLHLYGGEPKGEGEVVNSLKEKKKKKKKKKNKGGEKKKNKISLSLVVSSENYTHFEESY